MKENEIDLRGSYQAVNPSTLQVWLMVRGILPAYSRQDRDSVRSQATNACLAAWRFSAFSWASSAVLGSSQMLVALYSLGGLKSYIEICFIPMTSLDFKAE